MTRKHFQLIATTIQALDLPEKQKKQVAQAFVAALASTNGQFDAERFVSACLGEG